MMVSVQNLDIMPLVSPGSVDNTPGQATRLKMTGHTHLSGRLSGQQEVRNGGSASSCFEGELLLAEALCLLAMMTNR